MGLDLVPRLVSASFICPDVLISASCLSLMAAGKFSLGEVFRRPRDLGPPGVVTGVWKAQRALVLCPRWSRCGVAFLLPVAAVDVGQARRPGWTETYLSQRRPGGT